MRPVLAVAALLSSACASPQEPARVSASVHIDRSALESSITNRGWTITWSTVTIALGDLRFTVAGETHVARRGRTPFGLDWLIPRAHAHPGHVQGGETIGEMLGRFVVDWSTPRSDAIGTATLFAGSYSALDFDFLRVGTDDGIDASDPSFGHTAHFAGTATKDGQVVGFTILLDAPEDRVLVGAPCEVTADAGQAPRIGLQFVPVDPVEGDHLLDDLDFGALADGDSLSLTPTSEGDQATAYNTVWRRALSHDHYRCSVLTGDPS